MNEPITLMAALLAGLAGSGHCVAMCGGMASLLSAQRIQDKAVRRTLSYNLGRITSYTLAGLLVGLLGQSLMGLFNLSGLAAHLRLLTGVLIALAGLALLLGTRAFALFEKAGQGVWQRLSPLAVRLLQPQQTSLARVAALGLLWGWLPCGMTYAMLATAAATGDALHAGALMAAFGLGTLPAMLGTGLAGMQLRRKLQGLGFRRLAGALLILAGVWTIQPWHYLPSADTTHEAGGHAHHHH